MNRLYYFISEAIKGFTYEYSILLKLLDRNIRFVIAGGYALRKYRQIHDIDVLVHPQDWKKLLRIVRGKLTKSETSGDDKYIVGKIEFFYKCWPRGFSYTDLESEGYDTDENGLPCWSKEQTIRWKKKFGRPKDLQDIQILERS